MDVQKKMLESRGIMSQATDEQAELVFRKLTVDSTDEDVLAACEEAGFDLSDNQMMQLKEVWEDLPVALADDELENVAGGGCGEPDPNYGSQLECSSCGFRASWKGDFTGWKGKCPKCGGKGTFKCFNVYRRSPQKR